MSYACRTYSSNAGWCCNPIRPIGCDRPYLLHLANGWDERSRLSSGVSRSNSLHPTVEHGCGRVVPNAPVRQKCGASQGQLLSPKNSIVLVCHTCWSPSGGFQRTPRGNLGLASPNKNTNEQGPQTHGSYEDRIVQHVKSFCSICLQDLTLCFSCAH